MVAEECLDQTSMILGVPHLTWLCEEGLKDTTSSVDTTQATTRIMTMDTPTTTEGHQEEDSVAWVLHQVDTTIGHSTHHRVATERLNPDQ